MTPGIALERAASAAEEALSLERQALMMLEEGWQGESGSAAAEFMRSRYQAAAVLVDALHHAAAALRSIPDDGPDRTTPQPSPQQPAPPALPAISIPAVPAPDFGAAISTLVSAVTAAVAAQPVSPPEPASADTPAAPVKQAAARRLGAVISPPPTAKPTPAGGSPASAPAPLLAAERPAPEPLAPAPLTSDQPAEDGTPCEIAADELPTIGE